MHPVASKIFAILLLSIATAFSGSAAGAGILDLLPSYPIKNVGDAIPDETIKAWVAVSTFCKSLPKSFNDFPAKADFHPKLVADKDGPADDPIESVQDPRYYCDDGDQTTYNGLLCAAGLEIGCKAVSGH
jgi:hypothetical protein